MFVTRSCNMSSTHFEFLQSIPNRRESLSFLAIVSLQNRAKFVMKWKLLTEQKLPFLYFLQRDLQMLQLKSVYLKNLRFPIQLLPWAPINLKILLWTELAIIFNPHISEIRDMYSWIVSRVNVGNTKERSTSCTA